MRRRALSLILVVLFAACQAQTPSAVPTEAPSARQTAAPSALFFDGFDMIDARAGWAWQGISRLFRTDDGGAMWRVLSQVTATSPAVPRVQFVNASDGFAVGASALCVTRDGAQTWEKIATPFASDASRGGSYAVQFDFVDANSGWAIVADPGGQDRCVKTTDGGRTWMDLKPRLGF